MAKVVLGLLAAVLVTIAASNLAFTAAVSKDGETFNQPWSQDRMEFVAWNGKRWSAWIRDDAFEQLPHHTDRWHRHANPSLAYTGWDGHAWQAKIDGEEFLLAHRGDWKGPIERTDAIRYQDWAGTNHLRTVAQLRR
jgi:hypothetical protein